jgi:hypothetical protein
VNNTRHSVEVKAETFNDKTSSVSSYKCRIAMAKAEFNKKKNFFYQQIGLKFEEETSEMLHLEHGFVWC